MQPEQPISAEQPDWSRESHRAWSWHPSRALLASLRDYERWRHATRIDLVLRRRLAVLRHRFWSSVTGADIPLGSQLGGGLLMPHPNGIVIHPEARVGPNCLLMQQVTLGTGGRLPGSPRLVGHVDVGAGAKLLGGITIGAHAVIGANAVVLCDVPAGALAVGVPARIQPPRVAPAGPQAPRRLHPAGTESVRPGDLPGDLATSVGQPQRYPEP